jgi:hypothetical protein
MTSQDSSHSIQHRGCGVRAASYSVGPKAWLPEACVWLETEAGSRRIWVHSFAHCFDAEKLTFPNKLDADGWALVAARTIIDRALEQLNPAATAAEHEAAHEPAKAEVQRWTFARGPLLALRRFKNSFSPR